MLTETIFAPLWVWLFISEIPPISVFIGGAVIILAIILKVLMLRTLEQLKYLGKKTLLKF